MLETIGERQRDLLTLLLNEKDGLTVDDLSARLQISRNAVRQHLTALERDRLVERGDTKPSGGRPEQLYQLTDTGAELFPRRYAWLAELLIARMADESGSEGVRAKLAAMGQEVGGRLRAELAPTADLPQRTRAAAAVMQDLGYEARVGGAPEGTTIEASNCVFHRLAAKLPEVCHFDLGLLGAFAEAKVDHQECMVRGGNVCRFRLTAAKPKKASEPKSKGPAPEGASPCPSPRPSNQCE